jgi:hypothetical protein
MSGAVFSADLRVTRRQWVRGAATAVAVLTLGATTAASASPADDFFTDVQRNDLSAVLALDLRGFDLNTLNSRGEHALHIALRAPALKVAEYLAQHLAVNVDVRNRADETPLMLAVLKGYIAIARTLIGRDADVNKTGWTPLHYAATYAGAGSVDQVQLLLEHHAYIDAESPNRTTPLMMAAQYGSPEVVQLLLDEGADASLRNDLQLNAMDFARRASRPSTGELIANHVRVKQPKGMW